MKTYRFKPLIRLPLSLLLMLSLTTGCEDSSSSGWDFGDNDPNLVACIGDSLTHGYASDGAPYPARLAAMAGKNVMNFGDPGSTSAHGASVIEGVIARKPGYVCILYGSNDAIHGRPLEYTRENLRYVIQRCKANQIKPILASPPRMTRSHELFDPAAGRIAEALRQLAREEGIPFVNLYQAFGDGSAYLASDGLHFNDAGGDFVAQQFNRRL